MENKTTALSVAENTENKKIGRTKLSRVYGKIQKGVLTVNATFAMLMLSAVNAFAAGSELGNAGEAEFNQVIEFFATWIGRIGLVVGFVGAIMFGLAIKNDDAEAKTRGLMTLASGFVVFAVTQALNLFMGTSGSSGGATTAAVDMISNFLMFTA